MGSDAFLGHSQCTNLTFLIFSTFHFVAVVFCCSFCQDIEILFNANSLLLVIIINVSILIFTSLTLYKEQIIFAFMYKLKSWYFYARKLVNILLPLSGPLQCHELGSIDSERAPIDVKLFQVLWSGMDSALPSRKNFRPFAMWWTWSIDSARAPVDV